MFKVTKYRNIALYNSAIINEKTITIFIIKGFRILLIQTELPLFLTGDTDKAIKNATPPITATSLIPSNKSIATNNPQPIKVHLLFLAHLAISNTESNSKALKIYPSLLITSALSALIIFGKCT